MWSKVKLSQYRQGAAGEGRGEGAAGVDAQEAEIARALLSNTDKEVIFDGLKKLYRKKVQYAFFFIVFFRVFLCSRNYSFQGFSCVMTPSAVG